MFKLTRNLPTTTRRLVLINQRGEGPCSMLVIRGERHYSSAPPKKKSGKLFWVAAGATVITGATVVYAKQNTDFREWLGSNMPWMDDLVAVVYEENMSLNDWAMLKYNTTTTSFKQLLFGKEGAIVEKSPSAADPPSKQPFQSKDYDLPQPSLKPCYVEEVHVEKPDVPPSTVIMKEPADMSTTPKIPVKKDLVELECTVRDSTKIAIDNYRKATESSNEYNRLVNRLVEASVEELDSKKFDAIRSAQKERISAMVIAERANKQAEASMDELNQRLSSGDAAPAEAVQSTRRQLGKFRADLKATREEFRDIDERSCIADRYWTKVESARNAYVKDLQALFPGLNISEKKFSMEGGDPDMLLVHTLKQVLHLQKELAEANTVREQRLKRAIASHDQKDLIEAKAEELARNERSKLQKEYYDKSLKENADAERKRRDELKKQMDLHDEHLRDKLSGKEKEVTEKFDKMVAEAVEKQKVIFAKELAEVRAQYKAVEDNVKARSRADAAARRAQSLWAAAESLLSATKKSTTGCARIENEIQAVEKAGGDDLMVKTVVKGISSEVRENGLLTENALREKYLQMEKLALRVALVSKDGAPLPVYFLSYLQSLLLFSRSGDIPQAELENQPTDFTRMDAFDILQRARYWIERNDIAAALRYVNLLQGASRTASASWREAAIKHLEIKQAAEAVMAHATANALANS